MNSPQTGSGNFAPFLLLSGSWSGIAKGKSGTCGSIFFNSDHQASGPNGMLIARRSLR